MQRLQRQQRLICGFGVRTVFSVFKVCYKVNAFYNIAWGRNVSTELNAKGNCEILTGISDIQCLHKGSEWAFISLEANLLVSFKKWINGMLTKWEKAKPRQIRTNVIPHVVKIIFTAVTVSLCWSTWSIVLSNKQSNLSLQVFLAAVLNEELTLSCLSLV